jgi:hypothetical protein
VPLLDQEKEEEVVVDQVQQVLMVLHQLMEAMAQLIV